MSISTGKQAVYDTKIDIEANSREQLVEMLNQQLADTFDLHSQTKQAHWNVKGIEFFQLHELFDAVAAAIEPFVDDIAERVTALGGVALGTARMAAANSTLPEYPLDAVDGKAHLEALTERVAAYAASNREGIRHSGDLGDPTSEDLLTEISRTVDKQLYFLESHLQGK